MRSSEACVARASRRPAAWWRQVVVSWQTGASLAISPTVGFFVAAIVAILLIFIVYRLHLRPAPVNRTFRSLQVLTAAFLSYSHGANDAQKDHGGHHASP